MVLVTSRRIVMARRAERLCCVFCMVVAGESWGSSESIQGFRAFRSLGICFLGNGIENMGDKIDL